MPEEYIGTKFRTVFVRKTPPQDPRLGKLVQWCRRFAELGLAPGGSGNVSIRSPNGFIISRTTANLGLIESTEFIEVLSANVENRELKVAGPYEPSSESMMHAAIYEARPEIQAVLHGHCDKLLEAGERLKLPVTAREQPYGTPEIVAEVLGILDGHDFILIRGHGFVALGRSADEAGLCAEDVVARLYRV